MTRTGNSVQVTDKGKPLWVLQPAPEIDNEEERLRATDELLEEVLREEPSTVSLTQILQESRR
jgi:hypothetical protein